MAIPFCTDAYALAFSLLSLAHQASKTARSGAKEPYAINLYRRSGGVQLERDGSIQESSANTYIKEWSISFFGNL